MQISSDQCRAARSLLNWTQGQLATNSRVSRPTIADFEANTRRPMKNNIRSITDCLFVAGVEFIPEEGALGVGVRFRERKLEYKKDVRIFLANRFATMRMRYSGEDFLCKIDLDAVDDLHHANFLTVDEFGDAIDEIQATILASAERHAFSSIRNGEMLLTYGMLSETAKLCVGSA